MSERSTSGTKCGYTTGCAAHGRCCRSEIHHTARWAIQLNDRVTVGMVVLLGLKCGSLHQYSGEVWTEIFLDMFQPVLHDSYNRGHGMCYPVCGMVHIKEPLLLIGKSNPCGSSGFPLSLSEWSFTICLMK